VFLEERNYYGAEKHIFHETYFREILKHDKSMYFRDSNLNVQHLVSLTTVIKHLQVSSGSVCLDNVPWAIGLSTMYKNALNGIIIAIHTYTHTHITNSTWKVFTKSCCVISIFSHNVS
jgi:hypothetical protein